ncbi:MAG: T9SS type A sorting domain-containing protein [Taibaiella sp.]|nr:T9SS type A sorting domain-containing protein [Taibaiella sp.]
MKPTCRYFVTAFLSVSLFVAKAKEGNSTYNSPVQFIQNKGQITDQHGVVRKDIDAKVEANGVVLFVGDGEMHYQWMAPQSQNSKVKTQKNPISKIENQQSEIQIYRMDVKLVGANKNAEVIFEEPTGYFENYYLAHTGENGVTAKGFQRVVYKNIYPNIDLVLYAEPNSKVKSQNPKEYPTSNIQHPRLTAGQASSNIKYDFIIHPGGNPADIKLRYEGATELKLVDGALVARTPFGTITEAAPYCYNAATKEHVISAYKLTGNTLSFDVGSYNGTLVIDPILVWGTYYGGTGGDRGASVCVDIYENVYICGVTFSSNNIATTGAHQASWTGTWDGFIAKFDSSGARLWGTYYGSALGEEVLGSISCDKWGNVYVAGYCDSAATTSALVTTGAHQTNKGGGNLNYHDALLIKLNTNGQRQWATLYGGNNEEQNIVATCDPLGNVYLAGGTSSTNNIFGTTGTHKPTINTSSNNADGFLAKFNTNGARLWGTYYGGDTGLYKSDNIKAVACDVSGNVYIGGYTSSNHAIATTGAHQSTLASQTDGFIAKMNGSNGTRIWGTYYGGNNSDHVQHITIDADNNILIAGSSSSTNNIASPGAYMTIYQGGGEDIFLAKFTNNGSRLWGTYYGGTGLEITKGLGCTPMGMIYLTGHTTSSTLIATTNSHQPSYGGGTDAFIAEFDTQGQLASGSYYGGNGSEVVVGSDHLHFFTQMTAASNAGRVYIGGTTGSTSNIATNGAHQTTMVSTGSNGSNTFLAAFETDTIVYIPQRYTDTVWCPGDTVRIVYGVNQPFRTGNAFTVELSNATGNFASPVNIGSHNANTGDTITCVIPMNTPAGTGYRIRITADSPGRVSWDNQWDIRIKALPANLVAGSNSPVCTGDSLKLTGSSSNTGITWAWSGPNSFSSNAKDSFIANAQLIDSGKYILKATLNSTGCSLTDTTTVEMRPRPDKPTAGSNSPVCEFYSVQLTTSSSTNGVSYSWVGPGSYSSSMQNPTVTTSASSTHAGDYISTATLNGCSNRDTTTVVILPKPSTPTAGASNSPLCARQDLQLTASNITGGSYAWYGPSAFTANTQNPVRANIQMGDAGAYYVYATVSGCVSDTDSVAVVVNTDPFVNIFPTPGASICQGKQVIFTAVPTNGGSTSYNWLVNGISTGSTGLTYSTTTLNNGDIVSCAMTSTGTCATPFIDTSNAITMTVQPILSPTVTMAADNMPPWNGGLTVTFTATPTHGGTNPEYQWKRNGQDITGATGATWGVIVNALNPNEDICVVLKSSYECAVPDTAMSNCITTAFTGIGDIVNNKNIKIYPNPTSTILHVEGVKTGATIELIDLLGRSARRQLLTAQGTVDVSGLVPGVYVVRVNGVVAGRVVKE